MMNPKFNHQDRKTRQYYVKIDMVNKWNNVKEIWLRVSSLEMIRGRDENHLFGIDYNDDDDDDVIVCDSQDIWHESTKNVTQMQY